MASSSSAVKVVLFRAAMLSRICWGLDAPMRTLVTLPSRSIHASAISASGDFVQGAYLCKLFLGNDALLQETAIGTDAAVLRDAVEVAVGQQTLRQRAEGDDAPVQPDSSLFQAVLLDGAVKDGVAVLVDDEGNVELVEDGAGFSSVSPL